MIYRSQINLSDHEGDLALVRSVTFAENGLPQFDGILTEHPSEQGASFTLVHYREGKPFTSYDVTIIDRRDPDFLKPLEVIYEWTGKGFIAGLSVTSEFPYYINTGAYSDEAALIQAGLVVAPMVVGTAGGFVIGLFACIPSAAQEIGLILIDKQEVLISYARYEYDDLGRLSYMRTFHPSKLPIEVVTTEFLYVGKELVPSETRVISHPEGIIRTVE